MGIQWIFKGLYEALAMFWDVLWALVLGFSISAVLQVFVTTERMSREFGRATLRSVLLATLFGAASSSCSYAAAAATKSAFQKGAAFVPAVAFMLASTNLVFELGTVLWLFLGWRFVLAEAIGAILMISIMWLLVRFTMPKGLEEQARQHVKTAEGQGMEMEADGRPWTQKASDPQTWANVGRAFSMDWSMVGRDLAIGFVIAGYVTVLAPSAFWEHLFLTGRHDLLATIENCLVGPIVAVLSFVCSVGNIPLADVMWSRGISFGGVVSFIYADLIIVPLLIIYARYYGKKMAIYMTAVLFASMVVAALLVEGLFGLLNQIPVGPRPAPLAEQAHFAWNSTTWLNLLALAATGLLLYGAKRFKGESMSACCMHH
jgi:uncharacterized membrane protein YraQ (UPF0718 family)